MAFLWHLETERLDLSASDDPYIQMTVRLSGNRTPCPRGLQMSKRAVLLAISVIRSGIGGQGKNADKHFAAVNPESQARRPVPLSPHTGGRPSELPLTACPRCSS